ncbi:MAG: hypothetical protein AB1896_19735 [Thermodesulfobacteriota bacterium]
MGVKVADIFRAIELAKDRGIIPREVPCNVVYEAQEPEYISRENMWELLQEVGLENQARRAA